MIFILTVILSVSSVFPFAKEAPSWLKTRHSTIENQTEERQNALVPFSEKTPQIRKNILSTKSKDTLGYITGTVTDKYGNPLKGVSIRVRDINDSYPGFWCLDAWETDSLGHYTICGADVPLDFTSCKLRTWGGAYGIVRQEDIWYNNKFDAGSADVITVSYPDTAKNINFELEMGGCISGYITGNKGPLNEIFVSLCNSIDGELVSMGYTNTNGYYIAGSLSTGSYKIRTENYNGYLNKWYNNKPDFANADLVNVIAPDTAKNINFDLEMGGCISGYIASAKGPLADVHLSVYDAYSKKYIKWAQTDSTGYYIFIGLPTGNYKVTTSYKGYADLYWNNKSDWNSADMVSVIIPDTTKNVNFNLYVGGKIKGQICGAKGPIPYVFVSAFNTNSGEYITDGFSDSTGNYTIENLPNGYYKLWALPNCWYSDTLIKKDTIHTFEWYNDKNNWSVAESVLITAPDSVLNINFTMENCGRITGTVYGSSMLPLDSVRIKTYLYISPWEGWDWEFEDSTGSDGKYSIKNLRTGTYKISAERKGYKTLWYNQKPDSSTANLVSVTMPNTTPNIDFNLTGIEESAGLKDRIPKIKTTQNPFIRTTTIFYQIPVKTKVLLKIYDITGRPLKTLVNGEKEAGSYDVSFNAMGLSAGIYFVRFAAGNYKSTKKLVLMR